MGKFKRSKGANGYDTDASDSVVSELSNGDSSTHSKSSIRVKLSNFRKKKPSDMTAFVGSASSDSKIQQHPKRSMSPPATPLAQTGTAGGTAKSVEQDRKRLLKDAKSRFNIGLVYLKTGDYAKAQENLEHSLFCHIQIAGHDPKAYTNDAIFAIAGVREKLGDCYVGNTAVVEKYYASDHYEESRRLLNSVDPEDASDNIKDMLQRVEEKLKQPEVANSGAKRKPPSFLPLNVNVGGVNSGAAATPAVGFNVEDNSSPPKGAGKHKKKQIHFCQVTGKLLGGTHICPITGKILSDMKDGTEDSNFSIGDDWEESAMAHLKRDNHRTAFNTLKSVKDGGGLKNVGPQRRMVDSMMKVAVSALKAEKTSVAADAYEEAYAVLKLLTLPNDPGENIMKRAVNGCIKCNKLLAKEMEVKQYYDAAISHRTRAYQLLDEHNRLVPACHQQVKIAYLHGEKEDYEKSTESLWEAIRGLQQGVVSVDSLAPDRRDLLVKCYQMQAICYAKSKKYKDALEQYDEVLPLIAKKGGQGGKEYNSALIHKSALLVTMGNHRLAALVDKYLKLADISEPDLIVDELDHVLALDTSAATHIQLGDVDKAIAVFKRKLAFVKKLPNSNGMKSDTLHKLGCLLANKNQHKSALSYLNESLLTKKIVFGGKHKSVLETMWAVAATNQTLGDNDKALNEYTVLLDKMANIDGMPVDVVIVQHSAGKLYFEEGRVDKAVQFFRQALHEIKTSGNHQLQSEITLNLANALSASGELDKAMDLYDQLLKMKSLKKTKIFFLARFDKSLLLIKMGEVEKGKEILHKIAENSSSLANGVRGKTFLKLGNLAVSDGNIEEALGYFENALDEADVDDLSDLVHTKRSVAMAQFGAGKIDTAIVALEDVLEDLSHSDVEAKSVNLLKAEIWNCLAGVYKSKGDLPQAKNFAKLALQAYKTELGETNPITLRNASNLQLLILEETEGLKRKEAKPIINAAKYELEGALEAFVSFDDPSFRLDVASLKTNLGFVALWQDKGKKARKLVSQIKDIELPLEHPLLHRISVLEERVRELEKKHGFTSVAEDTLKNDGQGSVKKPKKKKGNKGGAYTFRS